MLYDILLSASEHDLWIEGQVMKNRPTENIERYKDWNDRLIRYKITGEAPPLDIETKKGDFWTRWQNFI